ncbi:hypothetical protein ES319_A06G196400v1 [Gossypium barbadense]|uniref:Protein kinase domain-containing protein n=1 Tax=Gossypium barbadense TaxID=3634 RepID=A0A5J5VHN2_GOSBA|nr:hypothetical protein ES319_A06G196400v1 [Gossypium barbadense]
MSSTRRTEEQVEKKNNNNNNERILRLGNYELGRTLGQGNFAKVKLAKHLHSSLPFAVKILDKSNLIQLKIADQIKREISTLKLLKTS